MPSKAPPIAAAALPELQWSIAPGTYSRVLQDKKGDAFALVVKSQCGWTVYLVANGRAEITKYQCMPSYIPLLHIAKNMVMKRLEDQLNKV